MKAIRAVVVIAAVLSGCASPFSIDERQRVAQAFERWRESGIRSYRFETRAACFCGPEHTEWATVFVENGEISAVLGPNELPFPEDRHDEWPTIDELYANLLSRDISGYTEDIRVVLDPTGLYPVEIEHTVSDNVQDGGSIRFVRNLLRADLALAPPK